MPSEKMNCFVDTNLIVYTIDPSEPKKRQRAKDFLNQIIDRHTLVLSPQSLNEIYRAVTEKRDLMSKSDARLMIWAWSGFCTARYDFEVTQTAWQIQDRHRLSWWDCMLLASASLAQCDLFLSEDLNHQQTIDGLTILNPFKLDADLQFAK